MDAGRLLRRGVGNRGGVAVMLKSPVKLVAPPEFQLPELDGVLDTVTAGPPRRSELHATHFDSADFALTRSGVTLRYRTDGPERGWTLELPDPESRSMKGARELSFDGLAGSVPPAAHDLVRGYLRSRPLRRVGRLSTRRIAVELLDREGDRLAEVVDDVVYAFEGRRHTGDCHEVEVELAGHHGPSRELLPAIVDRLVAAGCRVEPALPRLARALGEKASAPDELAVPDLGDSPTVAGLIRATLARSVARLIRHDAGVRLGGDPEDLHQFRVATRRLRSDLQTFASVLEPPWVGPLRAELAWLGAEVGAARDADVLRERLGAQGATLPERDAVGVRLLLSRLDGQCADARSAALAALRSHRYDALLNALVDAAQRPELCESTTSLPVGRARRVVVRALRRQWRRLARAVHVPGEQPSDGELHRVRIRARRCRYAAEAAEPMIGQRAAGLARAVAAVQDVLGRQHDTVLAEAWLRETAAATPETALVAGQLIAAQRTENARLRASWGEAWKATAARKLAVWP